MMDFIERLKAKPEHVRRRIAVGTAAGITGVVTAAWFFTLLFAGTLSLAIPEGGVNSGTLAQTNTSNSSGNTANLAAVNASSAEVPQQSNLARLLAAVGISTAPAPKPALKVEDLAATSSGQQASPTVIPF
jgi:hypothetical protein